MAKYILYDEHGEIRFTVGSKDKLIDLLMMLRFADSELEVIK